MNEFIITFRETLEATLIVGIIYVFLSKHNLSGAIQKLWLAVALSILASLIIGYVVMAHKSH